MILFGLHGPVLIPLVVIFVVLLYIYGSRPMRVLQSIGVPIASGSRLYVGHIFQLINAVTPGQYDIDLIKKYGKVFGVVEFTSPAVVIADPSLLKDVLVKQFRSFMDRRPIPLRSWLKLSIVDQNGAEWKRIRTMVTPFFSAAKLKHSFAVMQKCSKTFVNNLRIISSAKKSFEAYSLCGALSMDVICGSAFGIQTDSLINPDDPVISMLRKLSNISFTSPVFFLASVFPKLSPIFQTFGINMFPSGYLEFFAATTRKLMADRKNDPDHFPDFIHTMMKAHEDHEDQEQESGDTKRRAENVRKGLTEKEIMAQTLMFLLAGYDTTAITLSFLFYNLAVNPSVQDRVYEEINTVLGKQEATYESIQTLDYLDRCIDESLRLFPIVYRFDRLVTEDTIIGGMSLPAGSAVIIPVWAIQHDPEIWPSPEKFDPDRFLPESRDSRPEMAHLPFGAGQRACVGLRFAQIEMKLAIVDVLRSFRITVNERTQIPLELEESSIFVHPKAGIWLNVELRATS